MTGARATAWAIGLSALGACGPAGAADLGPRVAPLPDGVPCDSPIVTRFPSVWLGHFSGGRSLYPGPGAAIALDWRDEKLCFPSRRTCGRFVSQMRRDFHRPEGYFTCLPIR